MFVCWSMANSKISEDSKTQEFTVRSDQKKKEVKIACILLMVVTGFTKWQKYSVKLFWDIWQTVIVLYSLLRTHQFTDLILTVWCWSGCGTDHSGGLIVCQLLDATLSGHYVTHLDAHKKTNKQFLVNLLNFSKSKHCKHKRLVTSYL